MSREEIRTEIKDALQMLGYSRCKVIVIPGGGDRYAVSLDGERFGVWDADKKTFVD